jgi:hypothetical protein
MRVRTVRSASLSMGSDNDLKNALPLAFVSVLFLIIGYMLYIFWF